MFVVNVELLEVSWWALVFCTVYLHQSGKAWCTLLNLSHAIIIMVNEIELEASVQHCSTNIDNCDSLVVDLDYVTQNFHRMPIVVCC